MKFFKKHTNIKALLICTLLYTCVLPATAQQTKRPDFSGRWLLDSAASQFNGIPAARVAANELGFSQHDTYVALSKLASDGKGGTYYFRDTVGFDGKPSVKVIPNTGSNTFTKTTTLKLSDDGKLIFSGSYKVNLADGSEQYYNSNETCSLSADGNTLTLERTSIFPDRTERVTCIYHKK